MCLLGRPGLDVELMRANWKIRSWFILPGVVSGSYTRNPMSLFLCAQSSSQTSSLCRLLYTCQVYVWDSGCDDFFFFFLINSSS